MTAGTGAGVARNGPPQAIDQRRVLVIIGALLLGMLLAALDQTIVATAQLRRLIGRVTTTLVATDPAPEHDPVG